MANRSSRRDFLTLAGAGASLLAVGDAPSAAAASQAADKFQLGLASYSFREFPVAQALSWTKRLGLARIAFKDRHLKLDATPGEIAATSALVKDAGLELYGGGVIYLKTAAEARQAFAYAKAAGMRMIIGAPAPDLLDLVATLIQENDIRLAIHNHGPGDLVYPTPASAYEKIKDRDRRLGLCIDVGHTQRIGLQPAAEIRRFADRLLDVHIKDVSQASAQGTTVEMGRGVIDIPAIVRALREVGYAGTLAFEFEKDGRDPLPGVAESVGYLRGVLAAL